MWIDIVDIVSISSLHCTSTTTRCNIGDIFGIDIEKYNWASVWQKGSSAGFPQSLKSPWILGFPWKVLENEFILEKSLNLGDLPWNSIGSPWFLVLCILNWKLNGYSKLRGTRANFSHKNLARFARSSLQVNIFPVPLAHYNSRTIVIIYFLSQEYLQVFMYIMCFNVSICFKMGSLYSCCDIITS